jgi:putative isomerase
MIGTFTLKIFISYYGVSDYDLTNLKVFLDRQEVDGFISRTIGITYPKPTQMFKPFMAQLVVLSAKQNGNSYDWLRGNYYSRLQKYVDRWFEYDADHNGLPVWDSADASGMDNQVPGPAKSALCRMRGSIWPAISFESCKQCR